MIHQAIRPRRTLLPHACGHTPRLIETRGHVLTDARLFGQPTRMYHVECHRCGVATSPVWTQRTAENLWAAESGLVAITHLQTLRIEAERGLLTAA
ncbi:MAG: hypothetical protein ACREO4_16235 [Lysobacter sp.]